MVYLNKKVSFGIELYDDEDSVLLCLAEAIPTLIDYVGGPSSCYLLLEPLEKLTQVEEVTIREKVSKLC